MSLSSIFTNDAFGSFCSWGIINDPAIQAAFFPTEDPLVAKVVPFRDGKPYGLARMFDTTFDVDKFMHLLIDNWNEYYDNAAKTLANITSLTEILQTDQVYKDSDLVSDQAPGDFPSLLNLTKIIFEEPKKPDHVSPSQNASVEIHESTTLRVVPVYNLSADIPERPKTSLQITSLSNRSSDIPESASTALKIIPVHDLPADVPERPTESHFVAPLWDISAELPDRPTTSVAQVNDHSSTELSAETSLIAPLWDLFSEVPEKLEARHLSNKRDNPVDTKLMSFCLVLIHIKMFKDEDLQKVTHFCHDYLEKFFNDQMLSKRGLKSMVCESKSECPPGKWCVRFDTAFEHGICL